MGWQKEGIMGWPGRRGGIIRWQEGGIMGWPRGGQVWQRSVELLRNSNETYYGMASGILLWDVQRWGEPT